MIGECYRTGVRGRFVCVIRWPSTPSKWCQGCSNTCTEAARLAGNRSGTGDCANSPGPVTSTVGGR